MKPDQDRLRVLLVDTIGLLCKSGLSFHRELRVQGLLGITVDDDEVFIVQLDEKSFADGRPAGQFPRHPSSTSVVQPDIMPGSVPLPNGRGRPTTAATLAHTTRPLLDNETFIPGFHDVHPNTATSEFTNEIKTEADNNFTAEPLEENNLDDVVFCGENNGLTFKVFKQHQAPAAEEYNQNDIEPMPFPNSFIHSFESDWLDTGVQNPNHDLTTLDPSSAKPPAKRKRRRHTRQQLTTAGKSTQQLPVNNGISWTNGDIQHGLGEQMPGCSSWVPGVNTVSASSDIASFTPADGILNGMWNDEGSASMKPHTKSLQGNRRRRGADSKEKIFVCQYEDCDKSFYRKDHLIRHQRQKHGKPFGVDQQVVFYCQNIECGKSFYKLSTLRRHMTEAHQTASSQDLDFS